MSEKTPAASSIAGKSDQGEQPATEGQAARLCDEELLTLDNLWAKYPTIIDYVVNRAYSAGFSEGNSVGFSSGKKQRDRQRRGKTSAVKDTGRPPRHNELMRHLLEEAIREAEDGITQDDALAAAVGHLLSSEHRSLFQEFEYLQEPKGRESFLAGMRRRRAAKEE